MKRYVTLTEREASMVLSADWPGTPWTLAIGDRRSDALYQKAFRAHEIHWSAAEFEASKDRIAACIRVQGRGRR